MFILTLINSTMKLKDLLSSFIFSGYCSDSPRPAPEVTSCHFFKVKKIKYFFKCKEELLDCFEKCDDAALYIKNRETFSSRSVLQKANEIELIMTNKELDEQFGK